MTEILAACTGIVRWPLSVKQTLPAEVDRTRPSHDGPTVDSAATRVRTGAMLGPRAGTAMRERGVRRALHAAHLLSRFVVGAAGTAPNATRGQRAAVVRVLSPALRYAFDARGFVQWTAPRLRLS